jgi:ubiquinone/menaquinone biosynthesis C-methylase UbiE
MASTGLDHPTFARVYKVVSACSDAVGGSKHRRAMLAGLKGRVIEVGSGPGMNFAHYPDTVDYVLAVEPEVHMRKLSKRKAESVGVSVDVVEGFAGSLPVEDGSFDAAVSSMVMCSVPDQAQAFAELYRVVRPGGELRFYEHVRAFHRPLAAAQDFVNRFWPRFTGGCNCNRDTLSSIKEAGFVVEECRQFYFLPCPVVAPVAPLILGRARRS